MPRFQYRGFDGSGAKITGEIDAPDVNAAKKNLAAQGVFVREITNAQQQSKAIFVVPKKVGLKELEFLTTELSVLLDAGLKIDKSVELLASNNKNSALRTLLDKISRSLRSGMQLSEALSAADPVLFDPLFINLVSIGETTGKLPDVFRSLAKDLAFKRELQAKIIQASLYPLVILLVCISSLVFIFNYVVPNMASMFEGKTDLPFYTQLLLDVSAWMLSYQWYLLAGLVVLGVSLKKGWQDNAIRRSLSARLLKVPLIGYSILLIERIRFNSGLTLMLEAGVAIDVALQLAAGSVNNPVLSQDMQIALQKVKRGEQLSVSLRQSSLYPDFYASLLAVGEESGELGRIFREIAERSQREFTSWVNKLTGLMEPLMIVVMGGIVGSVVVVMMLSITSTSGAGF